MAVVHESTGDQAFGTDDSVETVAPFGVVAGNALILEIYIRSTSSITIITPTGWTALGYAADSDGAVFSAVGLFGRVADETANDTPTVSLSGSPTSGWHSRMARFSGNDTTTPVSDSDTLITAAGGSSAEIPQMAVARNGSMAVACAGQVSGSSPGSITLPTGWTELFDDHRSGEYRSQVVGCYKEFNAGNTDSGDLIQGFPLTNQELPCSAAIIQPPSGGGGGATARNLTLLGVG